MKSVCVQSCTLSHRQERENPLMHRLPDAQFFPLLDKVFLCLFKPWPSN